MFIDRIHKEQYLILFIYYKNHQISIDVSWQPNDLGRYYDYDNLSQVSDFLFVMAYDEPLRKAYQAGPNSGLDYANKGNKNKVL